MVTLALIAHDGKKADLVAWATFNREVLARGRLITTAGTARLLREKGGLKVEAVRAGPEGGDIQVGARVVQGTESTPWISTPTSRISRRWCAFATSTTFPSLLM